MSIYIICNFANSCTMLHSAFGLHYIVHSSFLICFSPRQRSQLRMWDADDTEQDFKATG